MANPILKKTSFALLRTNPKLTTNIKLIADSKNKLFLESFDATPELSTSTYKGFEVNPYGFYSYDLNRFYNRNQDILSENVAYYVYEEDPSINVRTQYNQQFDFTYGYGFANKDSNFYSEEYSIFAPIWLERDNIPEYFVIFKMDGPSSVNINDQDVIASVPANPNFDTEPLLDTLVKDPSYFNQNFIKKSKILKTFDLSENTAIGKYIRNHINDSIFPESSFFGSQEKDNNSYWNGISYRNGGFCSISKEIYLDHTIVDKTMIESDDYITNGFKTNSVVCANILNLEFLFDDENQTKYDFSRYYGLYMSEVELGKFIIDKDRLFEDLDSETTQLPLPTFNNVGDYMNEESQIQTNVNGIKIYPKIGASGPYNGRLLTWSEIQNPRYAYVKDTNGKFYSINNQINWNTKNLTDTGVVEDTNFLRIKDNAVNWRDFSGMEKPFSYVPIRITPERGRSSVAFKVTSTPGSSDQIRIKFTDWNNNNEIENIDNYTIIADDNLSPGTSNDRYFSNKGSFTQIAQSITDAINNLTNVLNEYQIFSAICKDEEVIIYTRTQSENWNNLKFSIFSENIIFPYDISSDDFSEAKISLINNYLPTPIATSTGTTGNFYITNFTGGNENPSSRLVVEKKYIQEFIDPLDEIYVKTKKGYQKVKQSLYLDDKIMVKGIITDFLNTNNYSIIELENNNDEFVFAYDKVISLFKLAKNTNGYFSIFPIKDFDFDFHSTEYNKTGDSNPNNLLDWYKGIGSSSGSPIFNWTAIGSTSQTLISSVIGPSSPFVTIRGFQSLIGYQDVITDFKEPVFNEYDRLQENAITELAVPSRNVPFINKWVYDNGGLDVRENPYRFNSNQAFGYSNFSPSFDQSIRSTKFYTHEWYYLQSYPPYMSFDDKLNSYSYFDSNINYSQVPKFPDVDDVKYDVFNGNDLYNADYNQTVLTIAGLTGGTGATANLYSINEDYFLSYFTRESIGGSAIYRDFKYSIFENGTNIKNAETLFRGVKVEIVDRFEDSPINFNKNSLKFINNTKYNGYKFSAVLTFGNAGTKLTIVKNDKWKAITLVIQADLDDALTSYIYNSKTYKFIDRSLLYCLESKLIKNGSTLEFVDRNLSGLVKDWKYNKVGTDEYFRVYFGPDIYGTTPKLNVELSQNENGGYNDVVVTNGTYTYRFVNIYDIENDTFKCKQITGLGSTISPLPDPTKKNELIFLKSNISSPWLGLVPERTAPLLLAPKQLKGGYNAYIDIMESISFSAIANDINYGDPDVEYVNITDEGAIEYNKYVINLINPDYPIIATYLKREPLTKSNTFADPSSILGYQIGAMDRITLSPVARYRGNYNPKVKDVFRFVDTQDLKNEGLDYFNIQILTDLGYIRDNKIGMLENLYYCKVNTENAQILKTATKDTHNGARSIYPFIGETYLDKKDYFVFRSNWDPHYYNKYLDKTINQPVMGTREPKEEKAFFASKTISVPDVVYVEKFNGTATIDQFKIAGNIEKLNKFLVTEEVKLIGINQLNIDVYLKNQFTQWLLDDGIARVFKQYISTTYSFGTASIWDDIKKYIETNIHNRYEIKEVILWEKKLNLLKGEVPTAQIVTDLTDAEKIEQGYVKSYNFRVAKQNSTDINFKLIYNIQKQVKTSIAISVVLQKK